MFGVLTGSNKLDGTLERCWCACSLDRRDLRALLHLQPLHVSPTQQRHLEVLQSVLSTLLQHPLQQ